MNKIQNQPGAEASTPWWRVKTMWLVLGGPLAVVVAGVTTAVIAVRGGDTVVSAEPQQQPAVQARNHAAAPRR
jgi:hypothetical protein